MRQTKDQRRRKALAMREREIKEIQYLLVEYPNDHVIKQREKKLTTKIQEAENIRGKLKNINI